VIKLFVISDSDLRPVSFMGPELTVSTERGFEMVGISACDNCGAHMRISRNQWVCDKCGYKRHVLDSPKHEEPRAT